MPEEETEEKEAERNMKESGNDLTDLKDEERPRCYLPTPPLGQDMTQGQFLSGV